MHQLTRPTLKTYKIKRHILDLEKTKILATESHLQKGLTMESININLYRQTSINQDHIWTLLNQHTHVV